MTITSINIKKIEEENSRKKGLASIVFDNCFVVNDIKIISGTNGLFVAMPSRKKADGTNKDIVHPINAEARKMIEDEILNAYNNQD